MPGIFLRRFQDLTGAAERCPQSAARQSLPVFVRLPEAPDESTILRAEYSAADKVYIFPDPYTGSNIQIQPVLRGFIRHLYFYLPSGSTGAAIVLITRDRAVLSALTGLFMYSHAIGKVFHCRQALEWNNRTDPAPHFGNYGGIILRSLIPSLPSPGHTIHIWFPGLVPEKTYYQEERAANIKKRFA